MWHNIKCIMSHCMCVAAAVSLQNAGVSHKDIAFWLRQSSNAVKLYLRDCYKMIGFMTSCAVTGAYITLSWGMYIFHILNITFDTHHVHLMASFFLLQEQRFFVLAPFSWACPAVRRRILKKNVSCPPPCGTPFWCALGVYSLFLLSLCSWCFSALRVWRCFRSPTVVSGVS